MSGGMSAQPTAAPSTRSPDSGSSRKTRRKSEPSASSWRPSTTAWQTSFSECAEAIAALSRSSADCRCARPSSPPGEGRGGRDRLGVLTSGRQRGWDAVGRPSVTYGFTRGCQAIGAARATAFPPRLNPDDWLGAPQRPGDALLPGDSVGGIGIGMVVRVLALQNRVVGGPLLGNRNARGITPPRALAGRLRTPHADAVSSRVRGVLVLHGQHARAGEVADLRSLDGTGHLAAGHRRHDLKRLMNIGALELRGQGDGAGVVLAAVEGGEAVGLA